MKTRVFYVVVVQHPGRELLSDAGGCITHVPMTLEKARERVEELKERLLPYCHESHEIRVIKRTEEEVIL